MTTMTMTDPRLAVLHRDAAAVGGCAGFVLFPTECGGALAARQVTDDPSERGFVSLCGRCEAFRVIGGAAARELLLAYLARQYPEG